MCDVVIMPSRWDGFGLVAIEAMRNSKPVIVSNRGALPELIKNNENGYIFDMDNLNSLILILSKLNKSDLKILGKNARKSFLKNFSACKFVNNIIVYINMER